ncbi:hypothetical protein NKH77_22510 [Streptomyces sp. M19]
MADDHRYSWLDDDAMERLLRGEPVDAPGAEGGRDELPTAEVERLTAVVNAVTAVVGAPRRVRRPVPRHRCPARRRPSPRSARYGPRPPPTPRAPAGNRRRTPNGGVNPGSRGEYGANVRSVRSFSAASSAPPGCAVRCGSGWSACSPGACSAVSRSRPARAACRPRSTRAVRPSPR